MAGELASSKNGGPLQRALQFPGSAQPETGAAAGSKPLMKDRQGFLAGFVCFDASTDSSPTIFGVQFCSEKELRFLSDVPAPLENCVPL